MKKFSIRDNLFAYLVSMRWPYSFVAGIAGWIGIIFSHGNPGIFKEALVLSILFVGWGINQVINDYLGISEDRLNAPNRPIVTGKLNAQFALTLSIILFLIGIAATYWLNPSAVILYMLVFMLNIVYERIKRIPIVGNMFFGLLIAWCVYYAAICASNRELMDILFDSRLGALAILVWISNSILCFFTDFKDYPGDRESKIKTLVVVLGANKAKYLGITLPLIPFICLYYFITLSLLSSYLINRYFLIMATLSFFAFLYPVILFFKHPQGKNTYYSLKWIIIAVVLFETTLIGLEDIRLSMILFILNFICVSGLFNLYYKDHLA